MPYKTKKEKSIYDKKYNKLPKVRKRRRAKCRVFGKKYRLENKLLVISHYSFGAMKCECCGESILQFLTIDDVKRQSNHKKIIGGGHVFYRWLIKNKFPKGFRVLCFNCNCGRGIGICPHKK